MLRILPALAAASLLLGACKGPPVVESREDLGIVEGVRSCTHYDYCFGTDLDYSGKLKSGFAWRHTCSGTEPYRARLVRDTFHFEKEPTVRRVREHEIDVVTTGSCS